MGGCYTDSRPIRRSLNLSFCGISQAKTSLASMSVPFKGQPPPARHLANAMTRLATMLIVAGLVGCHRSPTAMIPMDRDAARLKIPAPASVGAAKLIRQCHTDPTVADGRYRGRRLLVSGTCLQVTADELKVGPGSSAAAPVGPTAGYVSCHGPDWTPLEPGKLANNADSADMAWTNGTKLGIAVTVEGTFKTCVPGSVPILVECKIVMGIRPPRSAAVGMVRRVAVQLHSA
jgi:hypothetical protein